LQQKAIIEKGSDDNRKTARDEGVSMAKSNLIKKIVANTPEVTSDMLKDKPIYLLNDIKNSITPEEKSKIIKIIRNAKEKITRKKNIETDKKTGSDVDTNKTIEATKPPEATKAPKINRTPQAATTQSPKPASTNKPKEKSDDNKIESNEKNTNPNIDKRNLNESPNIKRKIIRERILNQFRNNIRLKTSPQQ